MIYVKGSADSETRISTAEVLYRGKHYKGMAICHPDDDWSEFTGIRYAETRAKIKALKDELKEKKKFIRDINKFLNKSFNGRDMSAVDNIIAKKIYKQLEREQQDVDLIIRCIEKYKNQINNQELAKAKLKERKKDSVK